MNKRISPAQEQALRERLQREAVETWPAYSESFHRRIVSAIERHRLRETAGLRRPPVAVRLRGRWAAVLTAACLLGAVVFGWKSLERGPAQERAGQAEVVQVGGGSQRAEDPAKTTDPDVRKIGELADRAEDQFDGLIAATTVIPQSDELKYDTRQAAQMLLRRLPVDVELLAGP